MPGLYPGRSQFRWSGPGIWASSSLHASQVSQRRGHPLSLVRLSSSEGPWQSPAHIQKDLNKHHSWCCGLRPELCVNCTLSSRPALCKCLPVYEEESETQRCGVRKPLSLNCFRPKKAVFPRVSSLITGTVFLSTFLQWQESRLGGLLSVSLSLSPKGCGSCLLCEPWDPRSNCEPSTSHTWEG